MHTVFDSPLGEHIIDLPEGDLSAKIRRVREQAKANRYEGRHRQSEVPPEPTVHADSEVPAEPTVVLSDSYLEPTVDLEARIRGEGATRPIAMPSHEQVEAGSPLPYRPEGKALAALQQSGAQRQVQRLSNSLLARLLRTSRRVLGGVR